MPSLRFKNLATIDPIAYLETAREIDRVLDEDVEGFLKDVDRHLESHLKRAIRRVPDVPGLKEGVEYQIRSGGKRIRAALCVTSCEMFAGSYLRALNFAATIEHLQNFTLVHDDIADADDERRAQESAWKRFGIPHAINIGDIFVPLGGLAVLDAAYDCETKLKLVQAICQFGIEVAEGQALDINLRDSDLPTVDEYMECTRKKTGAFMAMATTGGAIIGGAARHHIWNLRAFSMMAGTAFQIKDDLLDLLGGKGRTIGSDILEGKRTLPAIHALHNCSEADRQKLLRTLNKERHLKTTRDIEWVCDLYRATKSVPYSDGMAAMLIEQAIEHLMKLPESDARFRLIRISRYLSARMH